MSIPIGKYGLITNEAVSEPYVFVQNDLNNTGGYFVFTSPVLGSKNGHDYWVLADELEQFFHESGWAVQWFEDEALLTNRGDVDGR